MCNNLGKSRKREKEWANLKGESWARRVMEEVHNKERDFMWISINKKSVEEEYICRKRTTADRQKLGERIFPLLAAPAVVSAVRKSSHVCNGPSPVTFIKEDSRDFLAFAVVFGIHSNFIHSSFTSFLLLYSWHNRGYGLHTLSCTFLDCFSSIFLNCFLHKFSLSVPSHLPSLSHLSTSNLNSTIKRLSSLTY